MNVLIIGAAGMIGRKLTEAILRDGGLAGRKVAALHLADVVAPTAPDAPGIAVTAEAADLAAPGTAARLVAGKPDVIFHLAAIVSGQAEVDLDLGLAINLDGTRALLDAIRAHGPGYCPRVVFTSSIAVFGAPFPEVIPDDFAPSPRTSYGAQKLIGEILVSDFSRRGLLDGVSLRLPTICIRPGAPNAAASGFFSGILREPLQGLPAVLPVERDVRHWFASPRSAVGFLLHAAAMDTGPLGHRRALNLPGVAATVGDQIAALERVAGRRAVELIRPEHDPMVAEIVAGWPRAFAPERALALGFTAERDFDAIITAHVEDELGGRIPVLEGAGGT
jgi:D-erythronate 2-dehydrogenase